MSSACGINGQCRPGPVQLVMMAPPVGLSCEQFEEHFETSLDSTVTTEVFRSRVFRDSSGRIRMDREVGPEGEKLYIANIADPVGRFIALLIPNEKTAAKMNAPQGTGFVMRLGWSLGKGVPGPPAGPDEDLGHRTIDSVAYQGTRSIFGPDATQRVTRDVWLSKELGLMGLVEASGSNWKHIARIQNLDRREPDPNLFAIPADFTVQILGD